MGVLEVSEEYLFRGHSREEVLSWVRRLSYFRFCRGPGGHANEPDQLLVAFKTPTPASASALFAKLGRRPGMGGHCELFGVRVFLTDSRYTGQTTISCSGSGKDPYAVSAEDVEAAARLEPHLAGLADLICDPPKDAPHCICPKYYPELWAR